MSLQKTLTRERDDARQDVVAGIKTILLHIQNDASLDARIDTALSLGRACGAHLTCLHVTPIEAYVAFDSFGGVFVMNDVIKALDDEEVQLRLKIEEQLRSEDVPWDYLQVTGNVPTQIIRHAALADLTIVGREPHRADAAGSTISLLGDLLHRSRTPLFVPTNGGRQVDPTGVALIAWDGSHEAANAVRASVGLLKLACEVRILQVREDDRKEPFPGMRLLEYLSRHDIHADLRVEQLNGSTAREVAIVLSGHASNLDAAYIVMGGYNHSRFGEYLFGGITRFFLEDCDLPLFITH